MVRNDRYNEIYHCIELGKSNKMEKSVLSDTINMKFRKIKAFTTHGMSLGSFSF